MSSVLPTHYDVTRAMLTLLHLGGVKTAQECYVALADRFVLTPEQRSLMTGEEKPENRWHNLCRQVRRDLVDAGFMHRGPRDRWQLTEKGVRAATASPESLGL